MTGKPLQMRVRYDTREDHPGRWTVFDIFTALPVEIDGYLQIDMKAEDAEDLADLLNYQESLKAQDE